MNRNAAQTPNRVLPSIIIESRSLLIRGPKYARLLAGLPPVRAQVDRTTGDAVTERTGGGTEHRR